MTTSGVVLWTIVCSNLSEISPAHSQRPIALWVKYQQTRRKKYTTPLYNNVVGVKQQYYIQTKLYRLQRKITIYGHFSIWSFFYIIYTFLGSMFKPCCIQNRVITNSVIKSLWCTCNTVDFSLSFSEVSKWDWLQRNMSVKHASNLFDKSILS